VAIRIVTADDLDIFWPAIQEAYPSLASKLDAAGVFRSDNPFLVVGDPTVPILVRLERYRISDAGALITFPAQLRNAINAAGGMSVQVTDFYPLPFAAPGGPAIVAAAIKLLATVLRAVSNRYPIVRHQSVWAQGLHPQIVNFMKNGLPQAGIPAPFPNAGVSAAHPDKIWHVKYIDAQNAVDSQAVDV
jgi:hypothetical protein